VDDALLLVSHVRTLQAAARTGRLRAEFSVRSVFERPRRFATQNAGTQFLGTHYRRFSGHAPSAPLVVVPHDYDRTTRYRMLRDDWIRSTSSTVNGTAVGVLAEGPLLSYALPNWGGACDTSGQVGGQAVQLWGTDRSFYEGLRTVLMNSAELSSTQCRTYFDDSAWDSYFAQGSDRLVDVSNAVARQYPLDGPKSTLSRYDAGVFNRDGLHSITTGALGSANLERLLRTTPVCSLFVPKLLENGSQQFSTAWSQGVSIGQAPDPPSHVYLNTNASVLSLFTPAALLHEVLHNITGLYDDPLRALVIAASPITPRDILPSVNRTSDRLREVGCVP
jgi:hypothetical protein